MNTVKVSFRIFSDDIIPDEISKNLNLKPDKSHKKGEFHHNPALKDRVRYKDNMWLIKSKIDETNDLEAHLKHLLDRLLPHASYLRKISYSNEIDFYCGIFLSENMSASMYLEANLLEKISAIGADISVTTYY